MTEYIISFLKGRHSVYILPADCKTEDYRHLNGVLVIPDSASAFDVVAKTVGEGVYEKWELTMLLSYFYKSCLGYPLCELSLQINGEVVSLELFDTPPNLTGLKLEKCKLLYTTSYTAPDLTEHTVYTASVGDIYRVLPVKSGEGFRPEILSTLRTVSRLPTALCAIGASDGEILLPAGQRATPRIVVAAALAAEAQLKEQGSFTSDGLEFFVSQRDDTYTVLAPAALLKINEL